MPSWCQRLVDRIYQYYPDVFKNDELKEKFEAIVIDIDDFRKGKKPVWIDNIKKDLNKFLNIFAFLEIIDVANDEISIYTENINPDTLGQEIIIDYLTFWLRDTGTGQIKILLKNKPEETQFKETKLYKRLKSDKFLRNNLKIRYVKDNKFRTEFNTVIADESIFKIKFLEKKHQNNVCLSADKQEFCQNMKAIFNRYFAKNRSKNAILDIKKYYIDFYKYLTLLGLIDLSYEWSFNNKYKKNTDKLKGIYNYADYFNVQIKELYQYEKLTKLKLNKKYG